jgi:uncharacterized protein YjbI with pentapeptide repeats
MSDLTRADVIRMAYNRMPGQPLSLKGVDLSGLDLSGLNSARADFSHCILADKG